MTLRQVINIRIGYNEKLKIEHENRILESRVLLMYYANMKNEKSNKTFEQIYRIGLDEEKPTKMPKKMFSGLLVNYFKAISKNE